MLRRAQAGRTRSCALTGTKRERVACPNRRRYGVARFPWETLALSRLVMKFGGSSVADLDRIRNVARHVRREVDAGHEVAVIVSAMAGKTNELVAWAREAAP